MDKSTTPAPTCTLVHPDMIKAFTRWYGQKSKGPRDIEKRWEQFKIWGIPNITQLQRYQGMLKFLEETIIPQYASQPQVNVASVGCSNGSEVYSILLRNWHQHNGLHVTGYDFNPENIAKARKMEIAESMQEYDGQISRFLKEIRTPAGDLATIKEKDPKTLVLDERIRKNLAFIELDITQSLLPEPADIITCMAVLNYYTWKGKKQITSNLAESLNPKGWFICNAVNLDKMRLDEQGIDTFRGHMSSLGFEYVEQIDTSRVATHIFRKI